MFQANDFSFLILILLAFVLVKAGFDTKVFDSIPKLLFNLCFPALILITFSGMDDDVAQTDAVLVVAFSVVYTIIVYPIARFALRRYPIENRREPLALNMILGNISFVGLPFIYFFFGMWGARLAILFSAAQDFFIWSVCYAVFAGKGDIKQTLKTVLNPCFVAILLGFVIAGTPLEIPGMLVTPISMIAGMTVPLALVCIGGVLAQNTAALRHIDRTAVISVAIKAFVLPALVYVVLTAIGFSPALVMLCTLVTALPAGLLSVIFAKEFEKDVAFANVAFVISTVLFILICSVLFVAGIQLV